MRSNEMPVDVRFMRWPNNTDLPLPCHESVGAAAFDLRAAIDPAGQVTLEPGARMLVGCGFAVGLPVGFEIQIRPRSGLALRHGVTVLNAPATIDSDYRGEVGVCLINHGHQPFAIRRGDRIAQALVAPVALIRIVEVELLDETIRGMRGFGSTGST